MNTIIEPKADSVATALQRYAYFPNKPTICSKKEEKHIFRQAHRASGRDN